MIAYLDCGTGVSGDKLLGALVDAGFDLDILRAALVAMGLDGVTVTCERRVSGGVTGVGLTVTEPGAPRRHWHDLRHLLAHPSIPENARAGARAALGALAEAEAAVHGVEVDRVHFHEIGAADTLVDTLGVALAMAELGITRLVASPVAVGAGTVSTEHGELPVPAPATALLLRDMPIVGGPVDGELTTPTGAALLHAFTHRFGRLEPMTLRRVGVGVGTRDLGIANVCRLLLGEAEEPAPGHEGIAVLETNIDHLSAEELAVAAETIRAAGALDVWQTPIVMKKGRSATMLSVLVHAPDAAGFSALVIDATGSLGVRLLPAGRTLVARDVAEVATSLGTARFKVATLPGRGRVLRVESDDAARLAAEHGLPVDETARVLERDASLVTGVQPMRQSPESHTTKPSD